HIRRGSDIDIQLFCDELEAVERHLGQLGWVFEREQVTIRKFGEIREYVHFHVVDMFAIELTVYPRRDLRVAPRSSTDGKPIQRVRASDVEALLRLEHPDDWHQYVTDGTVRGLAELLDDSEPPGPFDGLLSHE